MFGVDRIEPNIALCSLRFTPIEMSHCGMIHIIQVDDVIPILPPAVGWVAAATLVRIPGTLSVNCLMLGGTKMWLNVFHNLVLIMLYGLVTG